MIRFLLLSLVVLVLAVPVLNGQSQPQHHPAVQDVTYLDPARRGQAAPVTLVLSDETNVSEARLIYCRVQHYACGPALRFTPSDSAERSATIPWTPRFFENVRQVGVRVEIEFHNGSIEHSPLEHFPARPADLPAEGDTYYYYTLTQPSSQPPIGALLAVLLVFVVMRR